MKALAAALLFGFVLSAGAEPLWVAVGEKGLRMWSRDGLEWKRAYGAAALGENLNAVVWGAGKFVATACEEVVGSEKQSWRVAQSSDGLRWDAHTAAMPPPDRFIFGHGTFIALRGLVLMHSRDGVDFVETPREGASPAELCTSIAAGDTEAGFRYVALGRGRFVAEESETWRAVGSTGDSWDNIQRGPLPGWVAYGAGHFVVLNPTGGIETSHDGQTWVKAAEVQSDYFQDLLWTGERFLACGARTWSSTDALQWRPETDQLPGKILWIRAGVGAFCRLGEGEVVFSQDFKAWQPTTLPKTPRINAIAYRDQ